MTITKIETLSEQAFQVLVQQIADHLGWSVFRGDNVEGRAMIYSPKYERSEFEVRNAHNPGAPALYFETRRGFRAKPGQILIGTYWPVDREFRSYCGDDCSINVGITKTAETIASDILRRLLPDYLEQYMAQVVRIKEAAEHASRLDDNRKQLCKALGDYKMTPGEERSGQFRPYRHGVCMVQVSSDTVRIETEYLSVEQAVKLIEFMRTHKIGTKRD